MPKKGSRVCSIHFVNGQPTEENLYPTKNLGYSSEKKVLSVISSSSNILSSTRSKRKRQYSPIKKNSYQRTSSSAEKNNATSSFLSEHNYATVEKKMETMLQKAIYPTILSTFLYVINGVFNIFFTYSFFLSTGFVKSVMPTSNIVLILKTLLDSALEENNLLKMEVARLRKAKLTCTCKKPIVKEAKNYEVLQNFALSLMIKPIQFVFFTFT